MQCRRGLRLGLGGFREIPIWNEEGLLSVSFVQKHVCCGVDWYSGGFPSHIAPLDILNASSVPGHCLFCIVLVLCLR